MAGPPKVRTSAVLLGSKRTTRRGLSGECNGTLPYLHPCSKSPWQQRPATPSPARFTPRDTCCPWPPTPMSTLLAPSSEIPPERPVEVSWLHKQAAAHGFSLSLSLVVSWTEVARNLDTPSMTRSQRSL
jgi:hypothetical protein